VGTFQIQSTSILRTIETAALVRLGEMMECSLLSVLFGLLFVILLHSIPWAYQVEYSRVNKDRSWRSGVTLIVHTECIMLDKRLWSWLRNGVNNTNPIPRYLVLRNSLDSPCTGPTNQTAWSHLQKTSTSHGSAKWLTDWYRHGLPDKAKHRFEWGMRRCDCWAARWHNCNDTRFAQNKSASQVTLSCKNHKHLLVVTARLSSSFIPQLFSCSQIHESRIPLLKASMTSR